MFEVHCFWVCMFFFFSFHEVEAMDLTKNALNYDIKFFKFPFWIMFSTFFEHCFVEYFSREFKFINSSFVYLCVCVFVPSSMVVPSRPNRSRETLTLNLWGM